MELQRSDLSGPVRGLVHGVWTRGRSRYVSIYSYATRQVHSYRLDRRGRLQEDADGRNPREPEHRRGRGLPRRQRARAAPEDGNTPIGGDADLAPSAGIAGAPGEAERSGAAEGSGGVSPRHFTLAPLVLALVGVVLLVLVVLPVIQSGATGLLTARMSYGDFMSREMTLPQLVSTVSSRVAYRTDVEDYWSAPADVWSSRGGDCEDHAMLISAYLSRHGVPHTVVGAALKGDLQGHVMVVADTPKGRYLLDPTRASAPTGLKRYPADTALAQIIREYAVLPASLYGESPTPGKPVPDRLLDG